jgi:hypothetical protein
MIYLNLKIKMDSAVVVVVVDFDKLLLVITNYYFQQIKIPQKNCKINFKFFDKIIIS